MSAFSQQKGGEIITLSFGPNANWTSRCFWELQERHHQLTSLRPSSEVNPDNETSGEQLGVASHARQSEIAQIYSSHGVRRHVHYGGTGDKRWPRALFFDLKDSPISALQGGAGATDLKGMSSMMGGSADAQEAALRASRGSGIVGATMAARSVWGGDMIVHRTAPEMTPPHPTSLMATDPMATLSLQHVAEAQERQRGPPSCWSDRWCPHLHPKSLNELQEYRDGVARFDVYTHGYEILAHNGSEQAENIFESFRCQLEDCDRVQGFQVFSDCDSGFGGLTQDFLVDYVKEECRSAPILTYGLMDSLTMSNMGEGGAQGRGEASGRQGSAGISLGGERSGPDSTMRARALAYRSINQGLALSNLSECSSVFVPVHAESLHHAAQATMWGRHRSGPMAPLHPHQAAAMLATSIDTIVLPFRVNAPVSSGSTSMAPLSSMSNLVRSVVGRRELNVASLLSRFEMPLSFPAVSLRERKQQDGLKGRDEWDDLHAYLSSHAPLHRVGVVGGRSGGSGGSGGSINAHNNQQEAMNTSTGHTAKSGGTGAASNESSKNEDLPCLLWSLSGQGLNNNCSNSTVTYGTHAVVRGFHGHSTVTVGRHDLSHDVLLDMYLNRTRCRNQSLSSFVVRAPVSVSWVWILGCGFWGLGGFGLLFFFLQGHGHTNVYLFHGTLFLFQLPTNVSRTEIYGHDENVNAMTMEEEAADLMEREMLKRFQSRRQERTTRRNQYYGNEDQEEHYGGETKHGGGEGDGKGVEPDWTTKSSFQVEEIACMAALDVSPRMYPLLKRTAEQLKRRMKSMLFEYEKGAKGIDADQFEEIVEKLLSRADAYEE